MEPNIDRGMWSVVVLLAAIVIGGVVLIAFPKITGKITNNMNSSVDQAFKGEVPPWGANNAIEDGRDDEYLNVPAENIKPVATTVIDKSNYESSGTILVKSKENTRATDGIFINIPNPKENVEYEISVDYVSKTALSSFGGHIDQNWANRKLYLDNVFSTSDDKLKDSYFKPGKKEGNIKIRATYHTDNQKLPNKDSKFYLQPNRLSHGAGFEVVFSNIRYRELGKIEIKETKKLYDKKDLTIYKAPHQTENSDDIFKFDLGSKSQHLIYGIKKVDRSENYLAKITFKTNNKTRIFFQQQGESQTTINYQDYQAGTHTANIIIATTTQRKNDNLLGLKFENLVDDKTSYELIDFSLSNIEFETKHTK